MALSVLFGLTLASLPEGVLWFREGLSVDRRCAP